MTRGLRKPDLTPEERALAESMMDEGRGRVKGLGLRAAAHIISEKRCDGILERKRRQDLSISPRWLQRQLNRGNSATVATGHDAPKSAEPWQIGRDVDARETEHQATAPEGGSTA